MSSSPVPHWDLAQFSWNLPFQFLTMKTFPKSHQGKMTKSNISVRFEYCSVSLSHTLTHTHIYWCGANGCIISLFLSHAHTKANAHTHTKTHTQTHSHEHTYAHMLYVEILISYVIFLGLMWQGALFGGFAGKKATFFVCAPCLYRHRILVLFGQGALFGFFCQKT